MATKEFGEARREMKSVLASVERQCLVWLAARLPSWINSDHLTVLALVAMLATGLSYYASRFNRIALAGAILGLAVNWFGDSLDGTLARVRGHQRPRYGFYVDHVIDCFGVLFVVSGLALSGSMSPLVAAGLLIAYFMLSIEIYLATYCLTVFKMSFWGIGPTELRILLAIGTRRALVRSEAGDLRAAVPPVRRRRRRRHRVAGGDADGFGRPEHAGALPCGALAGTVDASAKATASDEASAKPRPSDVSDRAGGVMGALFLKTHGRRWAMFNAVGVAGLLFQLACLAMLKARAWPSLSGWPRSWRSS